jgi:hypothetical protein
MIDIIVIQKQYHIKVKAVHGDSITGETPLLLQKTVVFILKQLRVYLMKTKKGRVSRFQNI